MASLPQVNAQEGMDHDEPTLHGLILESVDSIAGPLAICAAVLTWFLVFNLTVPAPEPAPATSASAPAAAAVLAATPPAALPDAHAHSTSMIGVGFSLPAMRNQMASPDAPALLYTLAQTPATSPHSLRADRPYATAGRVAASSAMPRP